MKKKILVYILLLGCVSMGIGSGYASNSDPVPSVNCIGLPGCVDTNISTPSEFDGTTNTTVILAGKIISKTIQYTAVIAVITLMLSGIMLMLSNGDEDKMKKAKSWIIWSLAGVFLTISAWSIINILNQLSFK